MIPRSDCAHAGPTGGPASWRKRVSGARRRARTRRGSSGRGAGLPGGQLPVILAAVETALAGRELRNLTAAESEALRTTILELIAESAPGVDRLQRTLADELRRLRGISAGSTLPLATVDVRGGVWIFFLERATVDAVIVGESFLPLRAGAPVPKRRPDPAAAGVVGLPRWRTADGRVVATPPPVTPRPIRARSGLGEGRSNKDRMSSYPRSDAPRTRPGPQSRALLAPAPPLRLQGPVPADVARTGSRIECD